MWEEGETPLSSAKKGFPPPSIAAVLIPKLLSALRLARAKGSGTPSSPFLKNRSIWAFGLRGLAAWRCRSVIVAI